MGAEQSIEEKRTVSEEQEDESLESRERECSSVLASDSIVVGRTSTVASTTSTTGSTVASTAAAVEEVDATIYNPRVIVCQSRALLGLFTKMRNVETCTADFVAHSKRAMTILAEEALAALPHENVTIQTPCGPCTGRQPINMSQVCAVSIVRSGDALLDVVRTLVPDISVGKILIQRDESHPEKVAKLFYSKLPRGKKYVLLCDPMLATGGSANMALDVLTVKYKIPARNIVFANVICCPEGLQSMKKHYPRVKIVTAMVDSHLNEQKFIVPGLGDYGDRYFGTEEL